MIDKPQTRVEHRLKAYAYTREHLERQQKRRSDNYLIPAPKTKCKRGQAARSCSRVDNCEGEDDERGESSRFRHYVCGPTKFVSTRLEIRSRNQLPLLSRVICNPSVKTTSGKLRCGQTAKALVRRSLPLLVSPTPSVQLRSVEWRRRPLDRYAFLTDNPPVVSSEVRVQSVVTVAPFRYTSCAFNQESSFRFPRKSIETR